MEVWYGVEAIYLSCGYSPDLEVVGSHEKVGNSNSHVPHNPLVKILGLRPAHACLDESVDHAVHAPALVLLGQHSDIVLEGVRDP
jgi:hypothetical protein